MWTMRLRWVIRQQFSHAALWGLWKDGCKWDSIWRWRLKWCLIGHNAHLHFVFLSPRILVPFLKVIVSGFSWNKSQQLQIDFFSRYFLDDAGLEVCGYLTDGLSKHLFSCDVLTGMVCSAAATTLTPRQAGDSYQFDTHQTGAFTLVFVDTTVYLTLESFVLQKEKKKEEVENNKKVRPHLVVKLVVPPDSECKNTQRSFVQCYWKQWTSKCSQVSSSNHWTNYFFKVHFE